MRHMYEAESSFPGHHVYKVIWLLMVALHGKWESSNTEDLYVTSVVDKLIWHTNPSY